MNNYRKDASAAGAKSLYARRSIVKVVIILSLLVPALLFFVAPVAASDIYVAQSQSGSGDGSSCANAYAITFFNTSGNWGSTAGKIGPGTTVHLCGTITTALTPQGNGASGSPVTVLFESGAQISLPTCPSGGCINLSGRSYITIDGQTNGIIQATANGTGLANHTDSRGIDGEPATNIEVKNLTIQNMYQYVCCSDSGGSSRGIYFYGGANLRIHHNIIHDSEFGIQYEAGNGVSGTGNQIYNNTIYNCAGSLVYDVGDNSGTDNVGAIHDNDISVQVLWCTGTSNSYHNDPIHIYTQPSAGTITGLNVYNNYIHGNFGVNQGTANYTAATYFDSAGSPAQISGNYFNNLIVVGGGHSGDGLLYSLGNSTMQDYNNTIDCTNSDGQQLALETNSQVAFTNNVLINCHEALWLHPAATLLSGGADYNDYYNIGSQGWQYQSDSSYLSFSAWKSATGQDSHSITSNPNLNSSYVPTSRSPVILFGANLTSLNIPALDSDKAGVARPASGAWGIGAYQFVSSAPPNSPTSLTATPH